MDALESSHSNELKVSAGGLPTCCNDCVIYGTPAACYALTHQGAAWKLVWPTEGWKEEKGKETGLQDPFSSLYAVR